MRIVSGSSPGYSIDKEMPRCSARAHDAGHVGQDRHKAALPNVGHELAGLDFRQIENVVDQREQLFPVSADYRRVVVLAAGIERRIHQQVGITEDSGHGGADFVAHVGQEPALGLIGGLGLTTRFDQARSRRPRSAARHRTMPLR